MTKTAWLGVLLALAYAQPGSFSCEKVDLDCVLRFSSIYPWDLISMQFGDRMESATEILGSENDHLGCIEAERDCDPVKPCCQGMTCKMNKGTRYGKCRSRAIVSGSLEYVVEFWFHVGFDGKNHQFKLSADVLGQCQGFSGDFELLNGAVSGLKWSDNVVLMVYDAYNCGGSSLLVYSSGPHKKMKSDRMTEDSGFLAGEVASLISVCKKDRCGYTSTSSSVSYDANGGVSVGFLNFGGGVGQSLGSDTAWDRCECTKTWNDEIRSFRVFRRNTGTHMDVRRRRREIPRKNLSPAEQ